MANLQEVVAYIRKHKDKYQIDALRNTLLKQGVSMTEIEEAIRIVEGQQAASALSPLSPGEIPEDSPVGFWVRAGAQFIDGVILMVAGFFCGLVLGIALAMVECPQQVASVLGGILGLVISCLYFTFMTGATGKTLGKMAVGAKVIMADGSPIGYGRALGRWFAYIVNNLTLGIGWIWAGFQEQKRGLHDYIAGTRVIYTTKSRAWLGVVIGIAFPVVMVFIIGILAAIAIPKFADLITLSKEGATRGSLGSLRSGLMVYYGETEGNYPMSLEELVPKYLNEIPSAKTPEHHEDTDTVTYYSGSDYSRKDFRDTGGWGYVNDSTSPDWGALFVNCTHTDSKGKTWYTW